MKKYEYKAYISKMADASRRGWEEKGEMSSNDILDDIKVEKEWLVWFTEIDGISVATMSREELLLYVSFLD